MLYNGDIVQFVTTKKGIFGINIKSKLSVGIFVEWLDAVVGYDNDVYYIRNTSDIDVKCVYRKIGLRDVTCSVLANIATDGTYVSLIQELTNKINGFKFVSIVYSFVFAHPYVINKNNIKTNKEFTRII